MAELERSRKSRASEVELTSLGNIGKGLFRAASGGYEVDGLLVSCECKDFRLNNAARLGRYPVRCKHLFAAQYRMTRHAASPGTRSTVMRSAMGGCGAAEVE